nr:unnamed protein product [Callosobruchus chinensis]
MLLDSLAQAFLVSNLLACISTDSTSTTISTSTGTSAPVADHVEGADDWLEELLTGAADWRTKDGPRIAAPSESNASSSTFDNELGVSDALENPLVDAANGLEAHKGLDHISVTVLKNKDKPQEGTRWYPEDTDGTLDTTAGAGAGGWTHHRHGQPSAEGNEIQERQPIFHSTCHTAMASCQAHHKCRALMSPVLHYCDQQRCNRNACMSALQAFYSKQDLIWNMEVAFCLCKKTDNKQDACLIAQEKLHPVCAQRTEDIPQPTCLNLAENCRENKECRLKLEHYEQSCAVDSVTKKCAGSPSNCRNAILGILGTDLRTTCACKGTDMSQLYECLGWQRLLWVNPCVVEAQKNFHVSKTGYYRPTITTTTTEIPRHTTEMPRPTPVQFITVVAATDASLQIKLNNSNQVHPIVEFIPPPQAFVPISTTTTTTATITTTTATTSATRRTRTTTTTTTTIVPPRSCVVQRPQFPDQYIREGSFKRIYHEDEFECSDICECEVGEKLTCRTICIDRMPCKTEFAYYNHAAPAYQAYRGRCLCYSGRFICMKPMPNDYNLPQGIYLFLGYSEVDERELNRNHTVVIVQDIVRVLQNILEDEAVNGDECMELLEVIVEKINARNPDFTSHLLLSIFKMAEVEIVQPEPASAATAYFSRVCLLISMALLTGLSPLNIDCSMS